MRQTPLITVKEARKLLGQDADELSDNQVQEIIDTLYLLAKKYVNQNGSKV